MNPHKRARTSCDRFRSAILDKRFRSAILNKRIRCKRSGICYIQQLGSYSLPNIPQGTYCQVNRRRLLYLQREHNLTKELKWAVCTKAGIWILGVYDGAHFVMGGVRQISIQHAIREIYPGMTHLKFDGGAVISLGEKHKLPFLIWAFRMKSLFKESISLITAFSGDQKRYLNLKTSKMDLTLVKPLPLPVWICNMTPYVTVSRPPAVYDVSLVNELYKPIAMLEKFLPLSIDSVKEQCLNRETYGSLPLCTVNPTEFFRDKTIDLDVRWDVLKMMVAKYNDEYYGLVYDCLPGDLELIDKVIQ